MKVLIEMWAVTIAFLFMANYVQAADTSKLVSEKKLNAAECNFVPDTSDPGPYDKSGYPRLLLDCKDQATIEGYNQQLIAISEYVEASDRVDSDNNFDTALGMTLLEKKFSAATESRAICMDRFRIIDKLIDENNFEEVISYYHQQILEYKKDYDVKIGCKIGAVSLSCPLPEDDGLLSGAHTGFHFFHRYTDFISKNDPDLSDKERDEMRLFSASLLVNENKFYKEFERRYELRKASY